MKRVGILTGGGDCPGLNPAIRGCVLRSQDHGFECVGILDGWKGLIEGKTMPIPVTAVDEIIGKGGTIIGTSRTNPYKKDLGVQHCLENFKRLGLDALVAMGGEDTLGVAAKLHQEHRLPVVGVPKTMDNDLSATDYTFGFDTAASIAVDAAERLKDTGKSHRRIMVLEVMGRHAGWVALFTGVASGADWICLPEKQVDTQKMTSHLKRVYERKRHALVVASEAIDIPGASQEKTLDEFGHTILKERGVGELLAQVIEKGTGVETRFAVIGHIQRGGPPTLFDRILGTRVGVRAADMAADKKFGCMAALRGNDLVEVSLSEAAGSLKLVNAQWLQLADILCK